MSEQKLFAGERLAGRPWIWFDLDDTLWNFHDNSLAALREIYREYELDRFWPTEQQWLDDYHAVNDELWRLYSRGEITRDVLRMERFRRPLVSAGCADAEAREMSAMLDGVYLGKLGKMSGTVPGAHDVLNRLRPFYRYTLQRFCRGAVRQDGIGRPVAAHRLRRPQ